MREAGRGRIINLASGTPYKGVPFFLHYVASKGAVIAMTRVLAKELGGDNVLVNTVAPGFTLSDGVLSNRTQVEQLQEVSAKARVLVRATSTRRTSSARSCSSPPNSPRSSPANRSSWTAAPTSIDRGTAGRRASRG